MQESSERLAALLRGERIERPPLWEVWFCMFDMLKEDYGDEYLRMCVDLDHAACPIRGLHTDVHFLKPVDVIEETGVHYGGGLLTSREQLDAHPEPDWAAQVEPLLTRRNEIAEAGRLSWLYMPWCFHAVATSMSLENFAIACYEDPELIRYAMEWVESRSQKAVEHILSKVRPDILLLDGDCAYKSGTMINPAMMRDFCFEPSLKTVSMIRDLGIPVAFHSDGKLDAVIPMLKDLGISAVHGCEKAANDLDHLVDTFGDDIVLVGNMDVDFMRYATVDEIRAQTEEMMRIGSRKGKYAAACNTSPLDYLPRENYRMMATTVRDTGR